DTADGIKARMRELETRFPKGLRYAIVYDTTPFIRESVNEVFHTLRDSVILVSLVILLFLQDWKALLLPVIDVAVSLVGTFAFMGGITGQFFRQFALTISVSMIISAINAMTMTPARAAWIFASRKPGRHGDQGKEALPWWSFALAGGLASAWLLTPTLGAWLGLPAGEPGASATGVSPEASATGAGSGGLT